MNGIFKIDKYNIRLTYFMNMRFVGELNKKPAHYLVYSVFCD